MGENEQFDPLEDDEQYLQSNNGNKMMVGLIAAIGIAAIIALMLAMTENSEPVCNPTLDPKGPKPFVNGWDGSIACVETHVKSKFADPKNVEIFKWYKLKEEANRWCISMVMRPRDGKADYVTKTKDVCFTNPCNQCKFED